jgi:hypothetical protein
MRLGLFSSHVLRESVLRLFPRERRSFLEPARLGSNPVGVPADVAQQVLLATRNMPAQQI